MTRTPTLAATAVDDLLTPATAAVEAAQRAWDALPARADGRQIAGQRAALGRRQSAVAAERGALIAERTALERDLADAATLAALLPGAGADPALRDRLAGVAPRLAALDAEAARLAEAAALLDERASAADGAIREASARLAEARRALDRARRRQPLLDLRGLVRDLLDVRAPFRLQDVVTEDGSLTAYLAAKAVGAVYRVAGAGGFTAYRAAYPALPDALLERRPRHLYGPARAFGLPDGLITLAEVLEVLERIPSAAALVAVHWTGTYDRGDERYRVHLAAGPTAVECETLVEVRSLVG